MASGVTIVQVAANPLTTAIGDPRFTHSRLTLAQAFNSLATMIGPLFGSALILAHGRVMPDPRSVAPATLALLRRQEAHAVQGPFVGIAVALVLLAGGCVLFFRLSPRVDSAKSGDYRRLFMDRRLMLGVVSIFAYVGAEVSIGSLLTNYLMTDRGIGGASAVRAGCWLPGQYLLGAGDGRPVYRGLGSAARSSGRGASLLRLGRGLVGDTLGPLWWSGGGGFDIGHWPVQLDHVPDHLHPSHRRLCARRRRGARACFAWPSSAAP